VKIRRGGISSRSSSTVNCSHVLKRSPRFESIAVSCSQPQSRFRIPATVEHLAKPRKIIDADRRPVAGGLEIRRVSLSLRPTTATGKLQPKTSPTDTHFTSCHWELLFDYQPPVQTVLESLLHPSPLIRSFWAKQGGGFYSFENGLLLRWTTGPTRNTGRIGIPPADAMTGPHNSAGQTCGLIWLQRSRNLCLSLTFP